MYQLHHSPAVRYFIYLLVFVEVMVLPTIEYPQIPWARDLGIPLWVSPMIELIIIAIYWMHVFVESLFLVRWDMVRKPRVWIFCITIILISIEDVLFIVLCFGFDINCKLQRFSSLLQPIIIIYHVKPLRHTVVSILKMPRLIEMLIVVFCMLLTFTFFMFFMFSESDQGDLLFYDMWQTGLQLYTLVTTTNYPDVMMPAYTATSWTVLIFVVFLLIMLFTSMKIVLALIFNIYTQNIKNRLSRLMLLERERLLMAFAALDPAHNGYLPYNVFDQLMSYLKPRYSTRKKRVFFRLLDTARNGYLNPEEFCDLLNVSRIKYWSEKKKEIASGSFFKKVRKTNPKIFIQKFVRSLFFDIAISFVIICESVIIISIYETNDNKHDCGHLVSIWHGLFLIFYTLEMLFRFFFRVNLKKFFSDIFCLFEITLLCVNYIAFLYSWIEGTRCHDFLERLLFFSPLLRLFRVMCISRVFRRLLRSMIQIVPTVFVFVTLEVCIVFYMYAIVGMMIWSGRIDPDNPDIQLSAYGVGQYYPINFDNFWRAYVTVYSMMVINNWQVIASGFVALDGQAAWIYFISFNVINYMIMLK